MCAEEKEAQSNVAQSLFHLFKKDSLEMPRTHLAKSPINSDNEDFFYDKREVR